ncbi:phage virion morphogenesis protein [Sphingobium yanoikuyae]|uniref:phage virion morphogenesis protein n=1 Tax=Sphingobium yanoikuyae TaxID=13690 RepID=UPI00084678EA|nr:phage virion morphogenesis protein [Sphingobium yanoikuyae]
MADDPFAPLELELGRILASIEPAARLRFARAVARRLRQSQAQRIAQQKNPDGSAFAPRKQKGEGARDRRGRIKRRVANRAMFRKLRQARWLRATATADEAVVGFTAAAARISRVHQLGLRDRVSRKPGAPEVTYPQRILLGLTAEEEDAVMNMAMDLLAAG